nr:unnamed protein product [Callosobruchus chinensis]
MLIEMSIENLIEVEKRPALYKKSLKEYSDLNDKRKLWEEVCQAVIPSVPIGFNNSNTKVDVHITWPVKNTPFVN